MRNHKFIIFVAILCVPVLLGASSLGWWDRLFQKNDPQVLQQTQNQPAPVQVDPGVINLQDSFAKVSEMVKPAVVNISAVHIEKVDANPYEFYFGDPNDFFYRFFGEQPPRGRAAPKEYRTEGTGSGVIIDAEGYVLTNNHVVQGAQQLTVTLANGETFKGKVIGTDPRTDLAVVKIHHSNPFPFARLGDSGTLRVGDWVLAIGSPFGLQQTVTAGIVSAIRQDVPIEGKTFQNMIQTDAAINRGNSGGPLVNIRGEVIGINTAIYAPTGVFSGVGFAIPVNRAKSILSDLIKKGFVERSWMGVEITALNEVIAEQFNLNSIEGALVNNVVPKSPADKAGIQRGDVIIEFNRVKIKDPGQLQNIVAETPPQKTVPVKVIRNGKSKVLNLTTSPLPQDPKVAQKSGGSKQDGSETVEWLGAIFSDLNDALSDRLKLGDGAEGVLILEVNPEGMAADAGLKEGDVIRAVNQKQIRGVTDLKGIMKDADPKKGLVFDVLRQGRSFYLSYKSL